MTLTPGTTIALTRSALDDEVWAAELYQRGLVPIEVSCLYTQALHAQAAELRAALERCTGLLFTSAHALHAVRQVAADVDLGGRLCACVGEATAAAAHKAGCTVEFVSPERTALSLGRTWLARVPRETRTCWPRAEEPRAELGALFEQDGRELDSVAVYRTSACPTIDTSPAQKARAIFFASPSAVQAFAGAGPIPTGPRILSIGPSTSAALRSLGCSVHGEARERNLAGMLDALEESLRSESLSK